MNARNFKHGEAPSGRPTTEYVIWQGMIQRCTNPNNKRYYLYGARGISVCDRWIHDFVAFRQDMGKRPSQAHSIDRYPNKNGNYEPDNCRWATLREQSRNIRSNVFITFNSETLCVNDWATKTGIHKDTIRDRLRRGLSPEEIFTLPVGRWVQKRTAVT